MLLKKNKRPVRTDLSDLASECLMPNQREQQKETEGFTLVLLHEVLDTISRQQRGFMVPKELLPALSPPAHTYDF